MPLRAILGGQDIIAPLLSDPEWNALRQDAQERRRVPLLPCCHNRALQRISPLGLKHFYHPPRAYHSACEHHGETQAHLVAKHDILQACLQTGYRARTEWAEQTWRADVLATHDTCKIAFEVQLSRLSLDELLERQERYRRAGVRGCWFLLHPPDELRRTTSSGDLHPRRDLPVFEIEPDGEDRFTVHLNGRRRPLPDLVAGLLGGQVVFRDHATAGVESQVTVAFFNCRCWECAGDVHVYRVMRWEYQARTSCGVQLRWPRERSSPPAGQIELETHPAVRSALRPLLESEAALGVRLVRRRPRDAERSRLCFGCPTCGTAFPTLRLTHRPDRLVSLRLRAKPDQQLPWPHWCVPGEAGTCCT